MKTLGFCQPKDLGKQSISCPVVTLAASDDELEHCLTQANYIDSKDSIPHDSEKEAKSSKLFETTLTNKNGLSNKKNLSGLLNGLLVQSVVLNNSTSSSCADTYHDKLCEDSPSSLLISVPDCLSTLKQQSNAAANQDKIETLKNDSFQSSLSLVSPNKSSGVKVCKRPSLEGIVTKLHNCADESDMVTVTRANFIEVKPSPSNNPLITNFNITPFEINCDNTANLRKDTKEAFNMKDCCKNYELGENSKYDYQIPLTHIEEKSKLFKENVKYDSVAEMPQKRLLINSNSSLNNVLSSDNYFSDKITSSVDITSDCSKDFPSNAHFDVEVEGKQYSDNVLNANSCTVNLGCKENITEATQTPDVSKDVTICNSSSIEGNDNSCSSITAQRNFAIGSDCSNLVDQMTNDLGHVSDGNIVGNHPKVLSIGEKNFNSPLSLSKSSSNTPMFSETPSDASQSDMMVKISDAVAALFSCTNIENLSEYVDPTPEEQKRELCKLTDGENCKSEPANINLNFTDAFINRSKNTNDLPCFSSSSKKSNIHNEPVLNIKYKQPCVDSYAGVNFLSPPSPSYYKQLSTSSEVNSQEEKEQSNKLNLKNEPINLEGADLICNTTLELNSSELTLVKTKFINSESSRTVISESSNDLSCLEVDYTLNKTVIGIPLQLHNSHSHSKIDEPKYKNGFVDVEKLLLQTDSASCKLSVHTLTAGNCEPLVKIKVQDNEIINKNKCLSRTASGNALKDAGDTIIRELYDIPTNNNADICENVSGSNFKNSFTSFVVKNKVINNLDNTLILSECNSEKDAVLLVGNSELCNDFQYCQKEIKMESQGSGKEAPVLAETKMNENECGEEINSKKQVLKENARCDFTSDKIITSEQHSPSKEPYLPSSKEICSPVFTEEVNVKFFSNNLDDKIKNSCLQKDGAIFIYNSSSDESNLVDFDSTCHADENSYAVKSLFIEENKDVVKFSLNDFLHQIFERDSGECNICKKFIEIDLKLHAAQEHSCITYIPAYLSEFFQHHMKERVGIFSFPCYNFTCDSPSYVCKTCGFILKSIDSVRLHMNIHENVYLVVQSNSSCKCEKIQYCYRQHKLKKLLLGSEFICSFCNYYFACEYGLINHLKSSHFRMNSCLLCNVGVSSENFIKVLAHNECHKTNTEQILSNLLTKDFIEPLRDQTYITWNALNNHLNYLDGKFFRLRTPKNIMNHKMDLSIPVKTDPEYAVTPDSYITSPALEINKYLKGKLTRQLTGSEIDEYASFGFDMPVQILFQKKFCSKKGRKRSSNTCTNKASLRKNTRISITSVLNLHKLYNGRHSTELEPNSLPLRRSSRHSKSNLEDIHRNNNKMLKQEEDDEVDVHLSRTRSGMRPKEQSEEDTSISVYQEPVAVQPTTLKLSGPPAEISGEWENYHTFVCCSCGAVLYDLAAIMDHKWEAHPGVWCAHTMIRGQSAVPEIFCRQYLPATKVPEVAGKKKISKTESYICTQCKENFSKLDKFHTHLIECGGLLQLFTSKKKTRNKKNFRFRRRKGQGIPSQRYANNSVAPIVQKTFDSGTSTPSKDLPFQSHQRGSMSIVKRRLEMAVNSIENKKLKNKLQVIISKTAHQKREIVGQRKTFKMKLRKKMQLKKTLATQQTDTAIKRNRSMKGAQISQSPAKFSRLRLRNSINKINVYDEKVSGTAKVILQDIAINEMKTATSKSISASNVNKNISLTKKQRNKKSLLLESSVLELYNNTTAKPKKKKQSNIKNQYKCHNTEDSLEIQSNSVLLDDTPAYNISDDLIKTTKTTAMDVDENYKTKVKKNVKKRSLRNFENGTPSLPCMSDMDSKSPMHDGKNDSLNPSLSIDETNETQLLDVPSELHKAKLSPRKIGSRLKAKRSCFELINKVCSLPFENDSIVEMDNENRSEAMAVIENPDISEISNNAYKPKLKSKKRKSFKNKNAEKFNFSESLNCNFHKKGFTVCPAKLNYTKSTSIPILSDFNSKITQSIGKDLGNNVFKLQTTDKISNVSRLQLKPSIDPMNAPSIDPMNAAPDNGKVFSKRASFTEKSLTTVTEIKEEEVICNLSLVPKKLSVEAVNRPLSADSTLESLNDFVNIKNFASKSASLDEEEINCNMLSMSMIPNRNPKLSKFVDKTKKRVKRLSKHKFKIGSEFHSIEKSSIYELSNAVSKCSLNSTDIESPGEMLIDENSKNESNRDMITSNLSLSSKTTSISDPPNAPSQIRSLISKDNFEVKGAKLENCNSNASLTFDDFSKNTSVNKGIFEFSDPSEQILNKDDKLQNDSTSNVECMKPFKKEKYDNLETAVLSNPLVKSNLDGLVSKNHENENLILIKNDCLKEHTFPEDYKKFNESNVRGNDVFKKVTKIKKRFVGKVKNIMQISLDGVYEELKNNVHYNDYQLPSENIDEVKTLDCVNSFEIKSEYQKNIPYHAPPPVLIKRKMKLSAFIELTDHEESKDDSDGASEPEVTSNFRRQRYIGRVGLRKRHFQSPRYSLRPPLVLEDKKRALELKSRPRRSTTFGNSIPADKELPLLEKQETCESDDEELIGSPKKFRKCNIGDDDTISLASEVKSRRSSFSSDDEMLLHRIKKVKTIKKMEVSPNASSDVDHLEGDEEIFQKDFERSVIAKSKSTPNKISVMDQLCSLANQKFGKLKTGNKLLTESSNFENIFNNKSNKGNIIKTTLNRLVCGTSKKNNLSGKSKKQKRLLNKKAKSTLNISKNRSMPNKSQKSLMWPSNKRKLRRRSSCFRKKRLHMTPEIVPSDCDSVSDDAENNANVISHNNPCENKIIETSQPSQSNYTETLEVSKLPHVNILTNHVTSMPKRDKEVQITSEKSLEKRKKNNLKKDVKANIVLKDNNDFSLSQLNSEVVKDDNIDSGKGGICLMSNEFFKKSKRKYSFSKKISKDCIYNTLTGTNEAVRVLSYKSLNTGSLPIKHANLSDRSEATFGASNQPDKLEDAEIPVKKKRSYKKKTKSELDENSPTVREIKRKRSVVAKRKSDISVSDLNSGRLVKDPMALFCADCGLSFDSPFSLEDHQQDCRNIAFEMCLMDEDLLFECPYCQLTFALKSTQRQHTSSCRAKRSRKNSSRKRNRQANVSNRISSESKGDCSSLVSNDQDLSALENVSQIIELPAPNSNKESLTKNECITEMSDIADRLFAVCEERPEFCAVCALLYTLKLNTNDMRNLLTSSTTTPSETVIQFHSNQLNCISKHLDTNYEMLQIILEQSSCLNLPTVFKSCLQKYSARNIFDSECVLERVIMESKSSNEICISISRPELLQALSNIEDLLKEAEEVQIFLKKKQMLHAMKETFQAGTGS